ncbi:MAG: Glu-tRNA(Gln) amidotransferase subunit GatE [Candidatus Methanomethyliaceae archaeon]|nr:Glu-tRNA(Gln) amidotransferase subunit GatE [Candidatus Methanomethyliaceae archaeon]
MPHHIKVGIEIHQQLDTSGKLFCSCPTVLREEEPHFSVLRRLKPTYSELGDLDRAVLFESERKKAFCYQGYGDTVCLVELDEEPPHDLNRDAVSVSLTVEKLLNMTSVDEVHVMRKIVIDGSNITGFQRTAKIAFDGWLMDGAEKISVQSLCLEEDAARKISDSPEMMTYRLDRLGIPLVEIATGPDIHSGEQAERVALRLGRILKATGRIKRGLGTIRQDLNISVEGGTRVEVKGVQELGIISTVVEYEANRQRSLLLLRDELRRRSSTALKDDYVDVTEVFASSKSKVIKVAIESGGMVQALLLPGCSGLLKIELQPGVRFGTELSDHAKVYGGVGGIFHTDELPAYGIMADDIKALRKKLGAGEDDCVVLVAADARSGAAALSAVVKRFSEALRGVPAEVRAANPDGTTRFMRPMPGSARMYPETDVPSIVVDRSLLNKIQESLPELLEVKTTRYIKEYGLSKDLAALIIDSPYALTFERLVKSDGLSPSFVAATFEYTFKMLRREGIDIESLDERQIRDVLVGVHKGEVAKEAVADILRWLVLNKGRGVEEATRALSLGVVDTSKLKEVIAELVGKNMDRIRRDGERAVSPLMGDLMKTFRGKVDGKVLHELLKEEIGRRLKKAPR